ncbi:hypothetical protein OHV13_22690 [Kitasatospora purpeofusca]|uniref:hypothetical protein n=1 Tax=Kitasatospora purpeofusca TaxID=67352 RepID=UPI00324FBD6B
MSAAVESQPGQAESRAVMRCEVVEAAGSHVLKDVTLGEFCTLPDGSGRPVLLAFPDAYHARLWLMTADTRKRYAVSATRVPAEERKRSTEEHADSLLFDLYAKAPTEPLTGPDSPDPVAAEVARKAALRSEHLRHRHQLWYPN